MIKKRLLALTLAVAMMMNCVPIGWAADSQPAQATEENGSHAAAVVSNTIYVPGKAIICFTGGVVWTAAMLVSFGACYKECGELAYNACTGKWMITPADMQIPK